MLAAVRRVIVQVLDNGTLTFRKGQVDFVETRKVRDLGVKVQRIPQIHLLILEAVTKI